MYTYALGRELGFADQAVVDNAVAAMKQNDQTIRSLIYHIVESNLFRTK